MAERVFLHVGLPKTGTTYLQTLLWSNREQLRSQGLLLPGTGHRQHLWASAVVREDPKLSRRGRDAERAWRDLVDEIRSWPTTAVVTHEFFAGASAEQAAAAVADLGADEGTEVHVVVTARDTLSLVTARWQEYVKNGSTVAIDAYPAVQESNPHDEWGWATMDLADVLERWRSAVPIERIHVITLPAPNEPRETLWHRFAEVVGIDPASCDAHQTTQNESLGVVEVELLRRVNSHLVGFKAPVDRGDWIRGYLGQSKLVPRNGEKFWPSPQRVQELCARGNAIVDRVAADGYSVIGDLENLRPLSAVPPRRHPSSVTDAELADAAAAVIADMLRDVRRVTREKRALAAASDPWGLDGSGSADLSGGQVWSPRSVFSAIAARARGR